MKLPENDATTGFFPLQLRENSRDSMVGPRAMKVEVSKDLKVSIGPSLHKKKPNVSTISKPTRKTLVIFLHFEPPPHPAPVFPHTMQGVLDLCLYFFCWSSTLQRSIILQPCLWTLILEAFCIELHLQTWSQAQISNKHNQTIYSL